MCIGEATGRTKRNRTGACALISSELWKQQDCYEEANKRVAGGGWRGATDHVTSCLVLFSPNLSVLTNRLF